MAWRFNKAGKRKRSFPHNGVEYKSGFELTVAKFLDEHSIPFSYERQPYNFYTRITKGVCLECGAKDVYQRRHYTPDFFLDNGIILEVKGRFMPANRTTLIDFKEHNPDIDVRMVFMRDEWLTKGKKKKYSDWCEQKGFKYCVGMDGILEWSKENKN